MCDSTVERLSVESPKSIKVANVIEYPQVIIFIAEFKGAMCTNITFINVKKSFKILTT